MIKALLLLVSSVLILSLQANENVTFKGTLYSLAGNTQNVGSIAPVVKVVTPELKEKSLGDKQKKLQVIITVPSIDTPVCDLEARTFNEKVEKLINTDVTVVSMDLPFAAGRYCAAHYIKNVTVASDFRTKSFVNAYGVLIKDGPLQGLAARAIFIVKDGKIVYKQLVREITNEPNYDDFLKAIKRFS